MNAQVVHGEILPQRPEWLLPAQERARKRDCFVREFDRQFSDWSEIARVCIDVDKDRDWEILKFHSFDSWIMSAAPRSRSYLYLVIQLYRVLGQDISDEELAEMPLASATVLKSVSSKTRRDPKVRTAAKGKTKELRQTIMDDHPDQLLESVVTVRLKFSLSAYKRIQDAYDLYVELIDPEASMETFLEFACSEVQP